MLVVLCIKILFMRELISKEECFWHLCTPGELSGVLFRKKADYVFGMNMIGLLAAIFWDRLKIYTFQIMSNHFHFIICGEKEEVLLFYSELYRRLKKFLVMEGRFSDIKGFTYKLIKITDLVYLRNVIAYVNRNGYLVDMNYTPFSYPWGANRFFFSMLHEYECKLQLSLHKIPVNEKRRMFHSHFNKFPQCFYLIDQFVSPLSYIPISDVEGLFKSAHHYYSLVSRRVESFSDIAKEQADKIVYTDEELSAVMYSFSMDKFNQKPLQLDKEGKLVVAKVLHFNYNANNQQIRRLLRLDADILNSLFPPSRR